MSCVEHILVLIQQAGYYYEELVDVRKKLEELLQQPSLDQQEREALQEISEDLDNRIENAVELDFENQLFADADAQAYNFNAGRGGQAARGGHRGRGAHGGRGGQGGRGGYGGHGGHGGPDGHGGHGGYGEHGGHGGYDEHGAHGGHDGYGGNSGSNDYRGGA